LAITQADERLDPPNEDNIVRTIMKIHLEATYMTSHLAEIDLPQGKSWDDVKDHYVKWGVLVLTFNDGFTVEIDGGDVSLDCKRPQSYTIFAANEDGDADYEIILGDMSKGKALASHETLK
jgi:hypothetical protein